MSTSVRPAGGELNAALTSAIVGIHNEQVGRGPSRAYSFHYDDVVVTIMHQVMTRAELTLVASGEAEAVTATRALYQRAMKPEFVAAVERLTGRTVVAFVSGNHPDPDIAVEVFMLDGAPIPG